MSARKFQTITGYVERIKYLRNDNNKSQLIALDHDYHTVAVARRKREVVEFLEKLRSKSAAK